ncbi:citrulline utilization hydrolase CtlX [Paremcibacter congregatus]|uniref:citrulline utilization hydrolase CtlX n=1 Tax=Paremcibacter congregatus TaxID=2043170 RepID=UPI0030EF8308|tara:strand:- start:1330 stop:2259 length:930 start_codon:yes stop_codon:yes gene_type:complete
MIHRSSIQAPGAVVIIRPHHFSPNQETASDNAYQRSAVGWDLKVVAQAAYNEVTMAATTLEEHGVTTHIFEDETTETPDSVFPNNWFSTHAGGHVALYPMYARNRRKERRQDVIEMLKQYYRVQDVIDYSGLEQDNIFLEGTGAMVLDHIDRVAYAIKSNRTDPLALERFCTHFNFEPMAFEAKDANGVAVYHTNVLMCITTDFVLIGLGMISCPDRRQEIVRRFEQSGREVIALSDQQIANFAANAIELQGATGRLLALSARAYNVLTLPQKAIIERTVPLVPLHVPTIEMAGGSVRCMLAGIHLSAR